ARTPTTAPFSGKSRIKPVPDAATETRRASGKGCVGVKVGDGEASTKLFPCACGGSVGAVVGITTGTGVFVIRGCAVDECDGNNSQKQMAIKVMNGRNCRALFINLS